MWGNHRHRKLEANPRKERQRSTSTNLVYKLCPNVSSPWTLYMQGRLSRPAKDRWSELGFELPFKGSVCSLIPTKILATTATTTEHFSEEYNKIQSLNNIIFTISKAEFKLTHPSKKQATMTPSQGKNYQWRQTLMLHLVDFKARIQIPCSMTKGTCAHKEFKCGIRCCKRLVRCGAEEGEWGNLQTMTQAQLPLKQEKRKDWVRRDPEHSTVLTELQPG